MDNGQKANGIENGKTHPPSGGLNILVVDDNAMIRQLLAEIFESYHCRLFMAENGKAALETLGQNRCDLILMDLQMPIMNGFETALFIREKERETGGHVPILALTGHPLENGREKCLEYGMDDYLTKPFHIAELIETVQQLTHNKL